MTATIRQPLHNAAQSREADAIAAHSLGLVGIELMMRAGRAACDDLLQAWPEARRVTVVAGKGNNAGDGYVLAALARARGLDVRLLQVGDAPAAGDAADAVRWATSEGVVGEPFEARSLDADVLVDALLGTGARGELRPAFAQAVRVMNASAAPVLAIDLPTGLNCDTGGALGTPELVVRASRTVSFITRKLGHHTGLGLEACGELVFAPLGTERVPLPAGVPLLTGTTPAAQLGTNAYKHARGHVLVAGGDTNMGGAVLLAAEAALRAGAGMVTVATRPEHRPAILARRPELMVVDAADEQALEALLERVNAVVLGPGLGRGAWGEGLFERVSDLAMGSLLIDADGLFFQAERQSRGAAVITPHVAEAARLLECTAEQVQANRVDAVRQLCERYGAVAVLKGAGTLIAQHGPNDAALADEERLAVCGRGNPNMATAGMGDVLSGVIAAELCRGQTVFDAVCAGVTRHAEAGDAVARQRGASLLAGDVVDAL